MSDKEDFYQIIDELKQFAELEGSEWGETAWRLTEMWQSRALLADKFIAALEEEIRSWLDNVKQNATIMEEVITPKPYTIQTLEWD